VPSIKANGISIYYEIHGQGEPLVLIGGLSLDVSEIEWMIRGFSQKYQVVAFDNLGAGRTDKPDTPYSIEMMAEDTAGLLNALGVAHAHVLGISMGGRIAIALTLKHPEVVRSLTLVSTSARMPLRRTRLWSLSNLIIRIPWVRRIGTKYPQPYYAFVRQREASRGYDATRRLDEILVPTLILHGRKDRMAPYELAEEMHRGIVGSSMTTFDGGHPFLFSKQEEFLGSMSRFLEKQLPSLLST
jgi:pimeloyl-ACP methyl ester carboxylesterase